MKAVYWCSVDLIRIFRRSVFHATDGKAINPVKAFGSHPCPRIVKVEDFSMIFIGGGGAPEGSILAISEFGSTTIAYG